MSAQDWVDKDFYKVLGVDKDASAAAKYAKANKDNQEASLAPLKMVQDAHDKERDRSFTASNQS